MDICLQNVVPEVFRDMELDASEIWQKDICFPENKIYLLEAVSGAGKSSLFSYLYGYRSDYTGNIYFGQTDICSFSFLDWETKRRQELSILFQDLRLFPELTAFENIELKNRLTGFKSKKWIEEALKRSGIEDKTNVPAGKLSFGQQQRVAFIRSLCQPFRFILLDEPVSHLDTENCRTVAGILLEEARQQGAGIIITSVGIHPDLPYDKILRL